MKKRSTRIGWLLIVTYVYGVHSVYSNNFFPFSLLVDVICIHNIVVVVVNSDQRLISYRVDNKWQYRH